MSNKISILIICTLVIISQQSYADARLEKQLGLSVEQSKQVVSIQKNYRAQFRSKRQAFNKESRKLRRARKDYDSTIIAQQEQIIEQLRNELQQIRHNENEEIRQILSPAKRVEFEEILKKRKAMIGSSRDEKIF